uniref:DUF2961 domain-containing protein n=1 Tax=Armatimonas sp. TaxID=1872638 RepID=UPI00286C2AAB
ALHVANPVPAWYGEGDEKVYVDGETWPSWFGTGTEDYFGYAWSMNTEFQKPYHAQVHSEKPGNFGHSIMARWHVSDRITFEKDIRFDLENWHWAEVDCRFDLTAYWYSRPGDSGPHPVDVKNLPFERLLGPKRQPGMIEGEDMKVLRRTGGQTSVQDGFAEPSGGAQLWWIQAKAEDVLELEFVVPVKGTYALEGNFCHAIDYGIHELVLDGEKLAEKDFFNNGITWKKIALGTRALTAGKHILKVICKGKNALAAPGQMFGLDGIKLKPVK